MLRIIILIAFLSGLASCASTPSYEPKLTVQPSNEEKYQLDLHECQQVAKHDFGINAAGGFGAIGVLAYAAATNQLDFRSDKQKIDDCMRKNGYN